LDHIAIDIQLVANQAIIECKCSVTHTTGVEMEALMGSGVAALTMYDMVKAVSQNVIIGQTALVSKSGGKSHFQST
jgi:cyclic pyranopterin phosphate synthase